MANYDYKKLAQALGLSEDTVAGNPQVFDSMAQKYGLTTNYAQDSQSAPTPEMIDSENTRKQTDGLLPKDYPISRNPYDNKSPEQIQLEQSRDTNSSPGEGLAARFRNDTRGPSFPVQSSDIVSKFDPENPGEPILIASNGAVPNNNQPTSGRNPSPPESRLVGDVSPSQASASKAPTKKPSEQDAFLAWKDQNPDRVSKLDEMGKSKDPNVSGKTPYELYKLGYRGDSPAPLNKTDKDFFEWSKKNPQAADEVYAKAPQNNMSPYEYWNSGKYEFDKNGGKPPVQTTKAPAPTFTGQPAKAQPQTTQPGTPEERGDSLLKEDQRAAAQKEKALGSAIEDAKTLRTLLTSQNPEDPAVKAAIAQKYNLDPKKSTVEMLNDLRDLNERAIVEKGFGDKQLYEKAMQEMDDLRRRFGGAPRALKEATFNLLARYGIKDRELQERIIGFRNDAEDTYNAEGRYIEQQHTASASASADRIRGFGKEVEETRSQIKDLQDQFQKASQEEIDPMRFYKNQSAPQRILSALALLAAGTLGGQDAVRTASYLIMNQVKNDVDSQIATKTGKLSALGKKLEAFGTNIDASQKKALLENSAQAQSLNGFASMLESIGFKLKGSESAAKYLEAAKNLRGEAMSIAGNLNQQVAQMAAASQSAGAAQIKERQKMVAEMYKSLSSSDPRFNQLSEADKLSQINQALGFERPSTESPSGAVGRDEVRIPVVNPDTGKMEYVAAPKGALEKDIHEASVEYATTNQKLEKMKQLAAKGVSMWSPANRDEFFRLGRDVRIAYKHRVTGVSSNAREESDFDAVLPLNPERLTTDPILFGSNLVDRISNVQASYKDAYKNMTAGLPRVK